MVKICLVICFSLLYISCTKDDAIDFENIKRIPPSSFYLKEYRDDNNLIQLFEYDSIYLTKLIIYSGDNVSNIQFIYGDDDIVDSAYISQKFFPRNLFFVYQGSLVEEFEVWNNNILRQRVIFDRDEEGRIIQMNRISLTYGLVLNVVFLWEDENISSYESTFYLDPDPETFVYEFKYDQYQNPLASAFEKIGFNFVDYMPITKNNWVELLTYKKNDSNGSKVLYTNTFSYGGNYPFAKESVQIEGKNRYKLYAEYEYKNKYF